MSSVSSAEAAQFCHAHGGRLPSEDEWTAAAAGDTQRRYPWGDTGAVCVRAAWGKASGQCGTAAQADAVGAHPRGATPEGIFDLAGNVSEWVTISSGAIFDVAKGGSFRSAFVTELRNWSRSEYALGSRDRAIGFRCVYDVK
jgi:formylglycine-generating enzyme required for sulfatase activity